MENENNKNNKSEELLIPIIVSNSYIKKYYLDKRLEVLPNEVKSALKIMFVELTEEVGGVVEALYSNTMYDITFKSYCNDDDFDYDEINAKYKLSQMERNNQDIFNDIAKFCKFKFNGIADV